MTWAADFISGLAAPFRPKKRAVGGYKAAEMNRLVADWAVAGLTPDEELKWSADRIRNRAQELERNSPIARHFLRMASVNVIGPHGFIIKPQVRNANGDLDRAVNEKIRTAWRDWSREVSLDGQMDLVSFERLALKSFIRDGEVFIRKWRGFRPNAYGFALELIDPELVEITFNRPKTNDGKNEVRLGVEVDQYGRRVAYHVWDGPIRSIAAPKRKLIRIPAEEIIHIYDPERCNQTRGMSWLAPVMFGLKILDGYREAELVAARISAAKMGFFEKSDDAIGGSLNTDEKNEMEMEAAPGTFRVLPDGYKIAQWASDHPSTAYGQFVKDSVRHIAVGLGVAYNSLNSDLESVNYSSMRSGLLIERDVWKGLQGFWACRFLTPIYSVWIEDAIINSARAGVKLLPSYNAAEYYDVRWQGRGWPWVDPEKDTMATIYGVAAGLISRTEAMVEQGRDIEETFEQIAEEEALAATYGIEIEVKPPPPAPGQQDSASSDGGDGSSNGNGNGRHVPATVRRF